MSFFSWTFVYIFFFAGIFSTLYFAFIFPSFFFLTTKNFLHHVCIFCPLFIHWVAFVWLCNFKISIIFLQIEYVINIFPDLLFSHVVFFVCSFFSQCLCFTSFNNFGGDFFMFFPATLSFYLLFLFVRFFSRNVFSIFKRHIHFLYFGVLYFHVFLIPYIFFLLAYFSSNASFSFFSWFCSCIYIFFFILQFLWRLLCPPPKKSPFATSSQLRIQVDPQLWAIKRKSSHTHTHK